LIQAAQLLADCQRLVRHLENDLRERLADYPDLEAPLKAEHVHAREKGRTGQTYSAWLDEFLTQVAVHWVLAVVFVRFLEDNDLIPEPWISGPGKRLEQARDRHERFFVQQPAASDREYLLAGFREIEKLPSMDRLFDENHNPLFKLAISADGARAIVELFRKIDPATGVLIHDFQDRSSNTRFLGDLYQNLSESARERYALLQTPEFVEGFILDRTLEPAIAEIGHQSVSLIDPACGSGHFLLGAFRRIFDRSSKAEPGTDVRKLALRAINQVAGVDVNPFAVAIARFRLLIAALKVSEIKRLIDAPTFPLNVAAGDSLLHGARLEGPTRGTQIPLVGKDTLAYVYQTEDANELKDLLGKRYTVVVGNPPYIIPKDSALNEAYRNRFGSCHRQYSLAVPFIERFFDLASSSPSDPTSGWIGIITANSFSKREFGKKIIEDFLTRWDLTHVIDTSGAYIPGHGTPTVILLARNRTPSSQDIRAILGVSGEPALPSDPSKGLVWTSIVDLIDTPGSQNDFISCADVPRVRFTVHPWSLSGGSAAELKEEIELQAAKRLTEVAHEIGFGAVTREDEVFRISAGTAQRRGIDRDQIKPLVAGGEIRNWLIIEPMDALWPYDPKMLTAKASSELIHMLWPWRAQLSHRVAYGQTQLERKLEWFEYSMFFRARYRAPLSICFAEIATHNHFALNRGGRVFNRTAPLVILPQDTPEGDHLALTGLLNSSVACFWLRQVCFPKGGDHMGTEGARVRRTLWEERFAFSASNLLDFPVSKEQPSLLGQRLDRSAQNLGKCFPKSLIAGRNWSRLSLDEGQKRAKSLSNHMIALQEELDWQVYRLYGLIEDPLEFDPDQVPEVALGERPFEIVLARKMAAGEIETKWFERHGSTPITEIPDRWPEPYRQLVEKRLKAIEENEWIRLIEQPEYKRRWNQEPWEEQEKKALREWLLNRLEDPRYWPEPRVTSTARLADLLRKDDEFRQIAVLYRGRDDFDWTELIFELAVNEAVPFLAPLRYAESGMRKRKEWERVWDLQRLEDAIDARTKLPEEHPERLTEDQARVEKAHRVGTIDVPPKYAAADFRKASYWRLRGKLDVPKERFIQYPGLERGADASPVIGWAGWDALQQAQALGTAFRELRENEGWDAERLAPVLAGLLEVLPWLLQWHDEPDPAHGGERLGKFFSGFLDEEARGLGLTREGLAAWKPEEKARRGRRRREA
jgi:SAM-dependent methyltransferase